MNEQALVDALESGKGPFCAVFPGDESDGRAVRGAGLDVFENEPKVHPKLFELPSVTMTPHIGTATVETRTAMEALCLDNIIAVLSGYPALTPVNECK